MAMLLLSIILLSVWGYHNYFSGNKSQRKVEVIADSSLNARNNNLTPPTEPLDNSPANREVTTTLLKEKLGELELLKAQITAILKNTGDSVHNPSDSVHPNVNEDSSRLKIKKTDSARVSAEITNILDSLKHQNDKIIAASHRLTRTVNKVKKNLKKSPPVQKTVNKVTAGADTPASSHNIEAIKRAEAHKIVARKSAVVVSNLSMFALSRDRSLTTKARETVHIMGSFSLSSIGISSGDLFIKIKRPDGKVIITNDSAYSLKVSFSSQQQRINFIINTVNLPRGQYTIEVYYHSQLIAQSSKTMI